MWSLWVSSTSWAGRGREKEKRIQPNLDLAGSSPGFKYCCKLLWNGNTPKVLIQYSKSYYPSCNVAALAFQHFSNHILFPLLGIHSLAWCFYHQKFFIIWNKIILFLISCNSRKLKLEKFLATIKSCVSYIMGPRTPKFLNSFRLWH